MRVAEVQTHVGLMAALAALCAMGLTLGVLTLPTLLTQIALITLRDVRRRQRRLRQNDTARHIVVNTTPPTPMRPAPRP